MSVFIQLITLNRKYLSQKRLNVNHNQLNILLTTFKKYHSQTVVQILSNSVYLGHLLSAFIVIYLPFSTKIVVMLLFTEDVHFSIGSPLAIFSLVVICNTQFMGIFAFHLGAAMFTSQIHSCCKGLLHWAAEFSKSSKESKVQPYGQLRLHLYIAKYPARASTGLPI